jgi:hypothetical protein
MKTYHILLISIVIILLSKSNFAQINLEKYLWEYPSYENLNPPENLTSRLVHEVDQILNHDFLRPLSIRYMDQMEELYILYNEPGRVMQTLAEAYPFLDAPRQQAVRNYVNNMFDDPEQRFWVQPSYENRFLPVDYGTPRVWHPMDKDYGHYEWWGRFRPTSQLIYHAWNYIYRTGDSSLLFNRYQNIKSYYQLKLGYNIDPGNLYGTMSAHIGMARLAHMAGDEAMIAQASNRLQQELTKGLDMYVIDSMAWHGKDGWNAPYSQYCDWGEYCWRKDYYIYRGFIFLNLSPEIGRYLKDHVESQTLARHQHGQTIFPFWWLLDAPHFSRWTGDETVGIPPEMFGMVIPIEKWVKETGGEELSQYFISSPKGIGDCFWLEGLVLAIEAYGEAVWQDVRQAPFFVNFAALPPEITQQPQDQLVAEGETATFSVSVKNSEGLEFTWFTPLGTIFNGNNAELIITNCTPENTGEYYCVITNAQGTTTSDTATLNVYSQHVLQQPAGWSGVSSYLIPLDDTIENITAPLAGNLTILISDNQMFWPEAGINTILNWDTQRGYIAKINEAANWPFQGFKIQEAATTIHAGWNLMPVLSSCTVAVTEISSQLGDDLILIKDVAGTGVYWPAFGVNTLYYLQPGRAYWVMAGSNADFVFPDCTP